MSQPPIAARGFHHLQTKHNIIYASAYAMDSFHLDETKSAGQGTAITTTANLRAVQHDQGGPEEQQHAAAGWLQHPRSQPLPGPLPQVPLLLRAALRYLQELPGWQQSACPAVSKLTAPDQRCIGSRVFTLLANIVADMHATVTSFWQSRTTACACFSICSAGHGGL